VNVENFYILLVIV